MKALPAKNLRKCSLILQLFKWNCCKAAEFDHIRLKKEFLHKKQPLFYKYDLTDQFILCYLSHKNPTHGNLLEHLLCERKMKSNLFRKSILVWEKFQSKFFLIKLNNWKKTCRTIFLQSSFPLTTIKDEFVPWNYLILIPQLLSLLLPNCSWAIPWSKKRIVPFLHLGSLAMYELGYCFITANQKYINSVKNISATRNM